MPAKAGPRTRLAEAIHQDVLRTWEKHGARALCTLAEEEPGAFVKLAVGLLPREGDKAGNEAGEAFLRIWQGISEGRLASGPDAAAREGEAQTGSAER